MFKSRFLAVFMSFVLALGMCPLPAFAAPDNDGLSNSKLVMAAIDDDEDLDDEDPYDDDDLDYDEDFDGEDPYDDTDLDDDESEDWDDGEDWGDGEDWDDGEDWGDDSEDTPYLDDAIVRGVSGWTYDGKSHIVTSKITVELDGMMLVEGEDYEIYFENEEDDLIEAADVKDAGDYTVYIVGLGDYAGDSTDVEFRVEKAGNPLKASAKDKKAVVKAKALKKKAATVSNVIITGAKGTVTCTNISKNKTAKKFKINASNGAVKVTKKTKAGKYPVAVQVSAKGDNNYKPSGAQKVSFTVQVKK